MTTPKPKVVPAAQHWEPYPDLPLEPRDMEQMPAAHYLREMLQYVLTPGVQYPHHPTVLIGDQIPIYYGPARPGGGPPAHVIPDCLVALDVDAEAIWNRVGYDPMQNGKPPDLVIEVASRSTYRNDATRKREIYRQIAVPEYWRFDPTGGELYGVPLAGDRLSPGGGYRPIEIVTVDETSSWGHSAVLGLDLCWEDQWLRWYDPSARRYLPTFDEETEARIAAEERVRQLEAEIRRLQG